MAAANGIILLVQQVRSTNLVPDTSSLELFRLNVHYMESACVLGVVLLISVVGNSHLTQ